MAGQPGWHFWIIGFSLTLIIEAPIVLWLLREAEPQLTRRIALLIFANLATHPLVWLFFPGLPLPYWASLTLSELWAFGAEIIFYWLMSPRLSFSKSSLVSCSANAASLILGWLIFQNFGQWLFRF